MLVRAANGMTAEEEAVAVWPTSYLAKAAQLGILDGVESIADFNAPALRGKLFEMVYNAVVNLQMGDYQVIKAIVLENYRVEKLNKDEVVVEIIEEVQRAKFVEESRKDMRGEQLSLTIPAKLADVEALLGRVANFTLDKAGNVIAISLDSTYKVEVLTELGKDDISNRKFDSYTVELSERVDRKDDRIFRTYYNNEDYSYEDFLKELGRDPQVEYAKVTVKNGKVVYIDAFNFDDIAPVKEVRADGATVVVYNDVREGTTKNITLKATDDILFVTEGNVSVGTREDIKALDVIHEYKGGFIVRRDADVTGTYTKVTSNRDNEYFVVVGGENYLISETSPKKAVYVYDEDEFYTLDGGRTAGSTLKEFEDEEVTILLDLTEKVQYVGAEVEMAEFVGIVTRVMGDGIRVLKSDDKEYDYKGDLDTKVEGSRTGHRGFNAIDSGDLVYVVVDGEIVEEIEVLTKTSSEVTSLDSRQIKLHDIDSKRLLSNTLYFRSEGKDFEALTSKQVQDAWEKKATTKDFYAYILNGKEAEGLFGRRAAVDKLEEAYVVVFTEIALTSKTKTHVVQFEGWANARKTEIEVRYEDGTKEVLEVLTDAITDVLKAELNGKDIIEIKVTDDDNKDVKSIERLISSQDRADVYEVIDLRNDVLTLRDAKGERHEFYTKDAEEFGGTLSSAKKVKISVDSGKYLDAVLVVSDRWETTANEADPSTIADAVVTHIDATNFKVELEDAKGKVTEYNITGTARNLFAGVDPNATFDGAAKGDEVKATFVDGRLVGLNVVKELADRLDDAEEAAEAEIAKLTYITANSIDTAAKLSTAKNQVAKAKAAVKVFTDLGGDTADLAGFANIALQETEIERYEDDNALVAAKTKAEAEIAKLTYTATGSINTAGKLATAKTQVEKAEEAVDAFTDLGGNTADLAGFANIALQETEIDRYEDLVEVEAAVAAVNSATTHVQMREALENNDGLLDIDGANGTANANYSGASVRLAVAEEMLAQRPAGGFANAAAIKAAFEAIVASL